METTGADAGVLADGRTAEPQAASANVPATPSAHRVLSERPATPSTLAARAAQRAATTTSNATPWVCYEFRMQPRGKGRARTAIGGRRSAALAAFASWALLLATGPALAHGAVCADYPNQRAAQEAADTRDADNDGIYCEALPCPCLKPGQGGSGGSGGSGTTRPSPSRPKKPKRKKKPYVAPREISGVKITSVIDGDTVNARTRKGGYVEVRLLGIDAPDIGAFGGDLECGGNESSDALEDFRAQYPYVTLITDPTQDRYDADGRLVAYVQADESPDYSTYQTFMLANGWAEVFYPERDFRRVTSFERTSDDAAGQSAGVWGLCDGEFHRPEP